MDFMTGFIEKHQLPDNFLAVARGHYLPLCAWVLLAIEAKKMRSSEPLVLGINGAQGTGKSTLADFIAETVVQGSTLGVAVVSIDDFYLTKADRAHLAETIHPFLATRGVPGTHDLPLAFKMMGRLVAGESQVALPRFDKAMDDRFEESQWPKTDAPVDLIILEGWCVGSVPEPRDALQEPVNDLESAEDQKALWRNYVNDCLADEYQKLFEFLDHLILLKAPDFEAVYRWRLEQEQKLAARSSELAKESGKEDAGVMSAEQVARFIQHYERLTRHNLKVLPEKADTVLELNQNHQVI